MSAHFASRDYWETRFTTETSYEWLADWSALRAQLLPLLSTASRVLIVGNGNSRLPLDVAGAVCGARILSSDYSSVVTARMREAWSVGVGGIGALSDADAAAAARVEWCEADMTALEASPAVSASGPFDVILDKGALDAVLADGGDSWTPETAALTASAAVCRSVAASLRDGGIFAVISFAQPVHRLQHLLQRVSGGGGGKAAIASLPAAAFQSQSKAAAAVSLESDDEWETDLTPDVIPGGAPASTDCTGTLWTSCEVAPIDAGLGYFLYTLRK